MPKPNDAINRACFEVETIEIRKDDASGQVTARGYAAVFEKLSHPIYNFKEKIRVGAFKNSLAKTNIRALWNHNMDFVLGSTRAGTLRLEEDDKGLRFELDLPDTQVGRDAAVSISRGDVDGMSFGFRVLKQEWDERDKDNIVRTLIDVDLREISPTAFPAYPQTKVKVRSIEDDYQERTEETEAEKEAIRVENENRKRRETLLALESV